MARTESNMLPLGTQAPTFILPDTISGNQVALEDYHIDKGLLIMFICNHCPFVIHVIDEVVNIAKEYEQKGITFLAISANDVDHYPQDSPENMTHFAQEHDFSFPYLYDEKQDVAKSFDAACTPDFYLFDQNKRLVYRGQMDGSRPGNDVKNDGLDLRNALDVVLSGGVISPVQLPSVGCNIKWKIH